MKIKKGIVASLIALIVVTGCQQPGLEDALEGSTANKGTEEIVNPYSLSYMQKVQDQLVEWGEAEPVKLEATHLYIKFIPMNKEEVDLLSFRNDLDLYDYPIATEKDEITASRAGVYRDPRAVETQPNPLYGAIAIGTIIPKVPYIVLDELYIPEEVESDSKLEESSLAIYEDDQEYPEGSRGRLRDRLRRIRKRIRKRRESKKWNPSARIRVWDDSLGRMVPLAGVQVRVRNWFRSHQGHTDANGNYYSPTKFRGDVSYFLKYEYAMELFDVRNGHFGQAFYNGPNNKRSKWNLDISSGHNLFWAQSFRAGAYLLNRNTREFGAIPYSKVTICALDKDGTKRAGRYLSHANNIWIYKNDKDGNRVSSKMLFQTLLHEFGHRLHDYHHNYLSLDGFLKESWGEAVSYVMTEEEYGVRESDSNQSDIHRQNWQPGGNDYSPMIIDLIDNHNQNGDNSSYLNDPITGYTLKQMWNIVKKSNVKTKSDFIKEVKALRLPAGVTRTMLNDYFNQY